MRKLSHITTLPNCQKKIAVQISSVRLEAALCSGPSTSIDVFIRFFFGDDSLDQSGHLVGSTSSACEHNKLNVFGSLPGCRMCHTAQNWSATEQRLKRDRKARPNRFKSKLTAQKNTRRFRMQTRSVLNTLQEPVRIGCNLLDTGCRALLRGLALQCAVLGRQLRQFNASYLQ